VRPARLAYNLSARRGNLVSCETRPIRASPCSRVSLLIIRLKFRAPGRSAYRRRRVSIINRLFRLPSWTST
jgi:hypothetical protein